MNLYEMDRGLSQKGFIVANSYARAVELWIEEYGSEPENVAWIAENIIVDPKGILK